MEFVSLVLLLVFLVSLYFYRKWPYYTTSNIIPGPAPEFPIGNMRNTGILSGRTAIHQVFSVLKQVYGDIFTFWFGPYRCLVFSRLEHVHHILTSRHIYETSDITTANFSLLIPYSMFISRDQTWKRHACVLLPMLKPAKIVHFVDTIVSSTDWLIDTHLTKGDGGRKDLVAKCQALFLSIIESIVFDHDLEDNPKKAEQEQRLLTQALKDYMHLTAKFIMFTGIPLWLGRLYLLLNWKYQNVVRILRQHCISIISAEQERKQQTESLNLKRKNVITFLVDSLNDKANNDDVSSGLTRSELIDNVLGIILGGFDTTSTALSWFIHYMSKNPYVQQRIKEELREHDLIPIKDNIVLSSDTINTLIYVDCVAKELFRFAPIATFLSRTALCDDLIDETVFVRQGETVFVSVYNVHMDPRYWNIDPSRFVPERFLYEDKNHDLLAFLPFGAGHRACAGQELAWLELKTIIVRLMQRVTFEDTGMEDNSGGYDQQLVCYPKHLAVHVHVDNE